LTKFIHAIDLDNPHPCWNLRVGGKLQTPNFIASIDRGISETYRSMGHYVTYRFQCLVCNSNKWLFWNSNRWLFITVIRIT